MQSGFKPYTWQDHRDYDFHASFGSVAPAQFPTTFDVDAGLWMPNQNVAQAFVGLDTIPALPFGCTDYSQTDLCMDEDMKLLNPMALENITHANAKGGSDIKSSLEAARQAFGRTAYFNIKRAQPLDWFDSLRLAMLSTPEEKRALTIGIPWYGSFERVGADGVLPMFVQGEGYTWHNAVVGGWDARGLKIKSWQGPQYGDKGWVYASRALANTLMDIPGTCAFTLSKIAPSQVFTINLDFVAYFVSLIRNLFSPATPPVAPQEPITEVLPPPAPVEPPHPKLSDFCLAIRNFEGGPGDRNYRNNNPGNCRYSSVGYAAIYKPVLKDKDGFAVFKDYATGWLYLNNLVKQNIAQHPTWTIYDFFANYAPGSDGNDPRHYAEVVASQLGVPPTLQIRNIAA